MPGSSTDDDLLDNDADIASVTQEDEDLLDSVKSGHSSDSGSEIEELRSDDTVRNYKKFKIQKLCSGRECELVEGSRFEMTIALVNKRPVIKIGSLKDEEAESLDFAIPMWSKENPEISKGNETAGLVEKLNNLQIKDWLSGMVEKLNDVQVKVDQLTNKLEGVASQVSKQDDEDSKSRHADAMEMLKNIMEKIEKEGIKEVQDEQKVEVEEEREIKRESPMEVDSEKDKGKVEETKEEEIEETEKEESKEIKDVDNEIQTVKEEVAQDEENSSEALGEDRSRSRVRAKRPWPAVKAKNENHFVRNMREFEEAGIDPQGFRGRIVNHDAWLERKGMTKKYLPTVQKTEGAPAGMKCKVEVEEVNDKLKNMQVQKPQYSEVVGAGTALPLRFKCTECSFRSASLSELGSHYKMCHPQTVGGWQLDNFVFVEDAQAFFNGYQIESKRKKAN